MEAGLVWSSKDNAELAVTEAGSKVTYIRKISNTNQFSVTIKGVPQGRFVRGKIFAKIQDPQGNSRYIYSEEHKGFAK